MDDCQGVYTENGQVGLGRAHAGKVRRTAGTAMSHFQYLGSALLPRSRATQVRCAVQQEDTSFDLIGMPNCSAYAVWLKVDQSDWAHWITPTVRSIYRASLKCRVRRADVGKRTL